MTPRKLRGSVRWRPVFFGLAGIAAVLGMWEGEAYWLAAHNKYGGSLLPTVQHVVTKSIPEMGRFRSESGHVSYEDGFIVLLKHSRYTVLRLILGTGLGVIVGIGLGFVMSMSRIARSIVEPPILVVRNIPLLALIPLFVLWFGGSEKGKIIYVAYAISVMIVINTVQAISNVAPIYRNYSRTLGASRPAVYRTVVLPAILPELLAGVKVALGVSWAIVLAAEFLAAEKGLGKLLILSEQFFDVGRMIVIVLVFIVYALILNAGFDRLTRLLCRWLPGKA